MIEKCLGFQLIDQEITTAYRLMVHNTTFCSELYTLPEKRNSYTVSVTVDGVEEIGQILYFVSIRNPCDCITSNCGCSCKVLAVLRILRQTDSLLPTDTITGGCTPHIYTCLLPTDGLTVTAVSVENITGVCVYMQFSNNSHVFVAQMPNCIECD